MSNTRNNLKREIQPMPGFVRAALKKHGLLDAFEKQPAYQRNDYLGWINRAKRQETKDKRLNQMLNELEKGGVYMNMKHAASRTA